jgi:hypothetical protein
MKCYSIKELNDIFDDEKHITDSSIDEHITISIREIFNDAIREKISVNVFDELHDNCVKKYKLDKSISLLKLIFNNKIDENLYIAYYRSYEDF